jgi:hypothetical protein
VKAFSVCHTFGANTTTTSGLLLNSDRSTIGLEDL